MDRPYVILNAAITLDGKISSRKEDSQISGDEDLDRAHKLRSEVDAVIVGIGTILSDNPELTVRRVEGKNPIRVIVDSKGRTPSDAKALDESAPTIVALSEKAEKGEIKRLQASGAKIIVGGGGKVDLESLLKEMKKRGIERVLLEGGSTLNWGMLKQDLVDEIRVAVRPCILGGEKAKTLVGGKGFEKVSEGIGLELCERKKIGKNLLLIYKRRRDPQ